MGGPYVILHWALIGAVKAGLFANMVSQVTVVFKTGETSPPGWVAMCGTAREYGVTLEKQPYTLDNTFATALYLWPHVSGTDSYSPKKR
jgi:hypothetical protein